MDACPSQQFLLAIHGCISCKAFSFLEVSCDTPYVSLGLRSTGCGSSGVISGSGGGGELCCVSSLSGHHPNPCLFRLGAQSLALVL